MLRAFIRKQGLEIMKDEKALPYSPTLNSKEYSPRSLAQARRALDSQERTVLNGAPKKVR